MKKWWKELIDKPLLKAFLHYYQASDSELTSVAVAYYWLISIFPLLLVVVNILPYFQIPVSNFLKVVNEFLPDTMYDVVAKIITEVLTQPSTGLLSFAVLSALWTFSKSMNFLQKAFNKAYGVSKNRGMISHQLIVRDGHDFLILNSRNAFQNSICLHQLYCFFIQFFIAITGYIDNQFRIH